MLTDYEKSSARHNGGKHLANRKSHLARVKTALADISDRAGTMGALVDQLSRKELTTLREASCIVARLERLVERDLVAARKIKATHDNAVGAAGIALRGLVKDKIADSIALFALAFPESVSAQADLARAVATTPASWEWRVEQILRDAVTELTHRIVNKPASPTSYCAALAGEMTAARERHADLISKIKAAAVQVKLMKAGA